MDQKAFNKVTKEVFTQYGFYKSGKKTYILPLKEVDIVVQYCSWRGVRYFGYYFSLRVLHDENIPIEKRCDLGVEEKMEYRKAFDCLQKLLCSNRKKNIL